MHNINSYKKAILITLAIFLIMPLVFAEITWSDSTSRDFNIIGRGVECRENDLGELGWNFWDEDESSWFFTSYLDYNANLGCDKYVDLGKDPCCPSWLNCNRNSKTCTEVGAINSCSNITSQNECNDHEQVAITDYAKAGVVCNGYSTTISGCEKFISGCRCEWNGTKCITNHNETITSCPSISEVIDVKCNMYTSSVGNCSSGLRSTEWNAYYVDFDNGSPINCNTDLDCETKIGSLQGEFFCQNNYCRSNDCKAGSRSVTCISEISLGFSSTISLIIGIIIIVVFYLIVIKKKRHFRKAKKTRKGRR